jgi:multidrug efflux pump subunit AcrA (membrane-fusion protein)
VLRTGVVLEKITAYGFHSDSGEEFVVRFSRGATELAYGGEAEELTGRVEAVNTVEVRPRVSGYLLRVHLREGELVDRGDLLFELDPQPFQAEVDRLSRHLDLARADVAGTESDLHRAERLRDNDGMSREEYDCE